MFFPLQLLSNLNSYNSSLISIDCIITIISKSWLCFSSDCVVCPEMHLVKYKLTSISTRKYLLMTGVYLLHHSIRWETPTKKIIKCRPYFAPQWGKSIHPNHIILYITQTQIPMHSDGLCSDSVNVETFKWNDSMHVIMCIKEGHKCFVFQEWKRIYRLRWTGIWADTPSKQWCQLCRERTLETSSIIGQSHNESVWSLFCDCNFLQTHLCCVDVCSALSSWVRRCLYVISPFTRLISGFFLFFFLWSLFFMTNTP